MENRKGFLTEDQEKKLDNLIEFHGIAEKADGAAIRLADNMVLEKLKKKIPEDVLPVVYEVIDEIFNALTTSIEK